MADEIRRSGRATKGQHTKNIDAPETPVSTTKRGAKGKGTKGKKPAHEPSPPPDEDEDDAIIRCICGAREEDEDDERVMVICDNCDAWQHNECMEISENSEELPDQYFCELCKPEDHKELLAKVSRGEKPWEERARQREREEAERKGRKRKGKKGKRGRPSEAKMEEPKGRAQEEPKSNGAIAVSPATVPMKDPVGPETPKVETGQKRKLAEEVLSATKEVEPPQPQQPQSKVRKVSNPVDLKSPPLHQGPRRRDAMVVPPSPRRTSTSTAMLQTELVESIDGLLSDARKRIAIALVRLFVDSTKQAQKQGSFKLPPGQSAEVYGNKMGLAVEYAVYLNFWGNAPDPGPQYGEKFRSINHNVKNNVELRDRLLNGSLSPNELSKMTSQDMASKELQEKTAEIKKGAEKQHIIQQEEGPRIRRTHKGEELVGDDAQMTMGSDSVFAPAPVRRRESQIDPNVPKTGSPPDGSPISPVPIELSEKYGELPVPAPADKPLTVDTNARPPPPVERQPSTAFDMQNVWSSVSGPAADGQHQQAPQREIGQQKPVQTDPEIDHLLKDEEPEEEEPYSPIDYAADPDAPVWRGKMVMMNVAEFSGVGKFVAGFNLSSKFSWPEIVPSNLLIEGRIVIDRASEYVCGLRYSNTTDVTVVAITPANDEGARSEFDKLFDYFTERERYGVVSTQGNSAVKDTYLVPLEAGAAKKPDFVELLEQCTIEDPTPERMLLLTMVIRSNPDAPSAQATPHVDGGLAGSPGTPAMHQTAGYPTHQTPVAPQPSPMPAHPYGTPQTQMPLYNNGSPARPQQGFMPPPQPQYQQSPPYAGPVGIEAARQALGELANTRSVQELIKEAPNTNLQEFSMVRGVLESVPATQNNFRMMKDMLAVQLSQAVPGGT